MLLLCIGLNYVLMLLSTRTVGTLYSIVSITTLCLKKVPTFKLSVTLSNLNRFSKILHCWKAYEISYRTHTLPTSP